MKNRVLCPEIGKIMKKSEKYVLAVSTGIDSMSLFHALYKGGYDIVVAHVNHKRRVESDKEYEYLKNLCEKLNVPFEGYEITRNIDSNFQEEARIERYKFFERVADKYNTKNIVTAHQLDDEAETVLMRLTRGTSLKGYQGMKMVSIQNGYTIFKPLLHTSREDIELYQKENNIEYFEDCTNLEDHYTRNKYRHEIITKLKEYNPSFLDAIINYSKDMGFMFDHIEKLTNEFYLKNVIISSNSVKINREKFNEQDEIIKEWILVKAVNILSNNTVVLMHERVWKIAELSGLSGSGKTVEIKDPISCYIDYKYISFEKRSDAKEIILNICDFGTYDLGDYGKVVISQKYHRIPNKNSYMLCYNELNSVFPITIRNRKDGDFITVNSLTKKVSDVLKDYKVPKRDRDSVLVVLVQDEIVFIPNILRKETDKTLKNTLYITFIKEDEDETRR